MTQCRLFFSRLIANHQAVKHSQYPRPGTYTGPHCRTSNPFQSCWKGLLTTVVAPLSQINTVWSAGHRVPEAAQGHFPSRSGRAKWRMKGLPRSILKRF